MKELLLKLLTMKNYPAKLKNIHYPYCIGRMGVSIMDKHPFANSLQLFPYCQKGKKKSSEVQEFRLKKENGI